MFLFCFHGMFQYFLIDSNKAWSLIITYNWAKTKLLFSQSTILHSSLNSFHIFCFYFTTTQLDEWRIFWHLVNLKRYKFFNLSLKDRLWEWDMLGNYKMEAMTRHVFLFQIIFTKTIAVQYIKYNLLKKW